MQPPIQGIIPALHTAFDGREEINYDAQAELVRRLLAQGVHGFFVCGTSGEFPLLTVEEREKLTELVAAEALGRAAIVVHVGSPRPADAVRLAQHAAALGVQGLSSVPPYYYAHREAAVLEYMKEVASSTPLPFYYYHIPERTGFPMGERFLEMLLNVPNISGMKYSHGDLYVQERLQRLAGPRFKIFCGCDDILLPSLVLGAAGAVGSTYNFLAPSFLSLWKAFQRGDLADALRVQRRANDVLSVLSRYPSIASSKEALRILGLDLGAPRSPQSRLGPDEQETLRRALLAAGLLEAAGQ